MRDIELFGVTVYFVAGVVCVIFAGCIPDGVWRAIALALGLIAVFHSGTVLGAEGEKERRLADGIHAG